MVQVVPEPVGHIVVPGGQPVPVVAAATPSVSATGLTAVANVPTPPLPPPMDQPESPADGPTDAPTVAPPAAGFAVGIVFLGSAVVPR